MNSAADLAGSIRQLVQDRSLAAKDRYFPTLRIPNTFVGQRISSDFAVDFVYTLKYLHEASLTHLGDTPIPEIIRPLLLQVDGPATGTFYSYRIAETILAFGSFNPDNPLLAGLTQAQRDNLAAAVDSTHVFDPKSCELIGLPNNYWAVLARCELDRQKLGLLKDDAILQRCIEKIRSLLAANPVGFFDDSVDLTDRFDLYSWDTHLFLEPMWRLLDRSILDRNLRRHAEAMQQITLENGAVVAWGRSIGALSVMMTIEFGALALRDNLADPEKMIGLANYAFERFKTDWWQDDLVNTHRHKMTFNYRGPHRLLQMTFDLLCKLGWVANALAAAPYSPGLARGNASQPPQSSPPTERPTPVQTLFPPRDTFIDFRPQKDDRRGGRAGVWIFRNNVMAFQLAVVRWVNADYVATPRSPGLFENPVDSPTICGVPRVWVKRQDGAEIEYVPMEIPRVEKFPNGLTLTYDSFTHNVQKDRAPALDAKRIVTYEVKGDTLHVSEKWTFAELPAAVSLTIPETIKRPLAVEFTTANEHSKSIVHVEGMQFWRSFWGPIARVHQVDFAPAHQINLTYTIMPAIKVAQGPVIHDYNRSLYDNIPRGWVKEIPIGNAMCGFSIDVPAFAQDADIVHIGWPEHLFRPHGMNDQEYDDKLIAFFRGLATDGRKIVWTMHNRRPHSWPKDRGTRVYAALAQLVDACFHHSKWGESIMRRDYPFKPTCKHYQLPHPHFGERMHVTATREELEKKYNLPPTTIRIGLLGRYQKEKQVEMILQAFDAANRPDLQLVYNTHKPAPDPKPENPPVAPNIIRLERPEWMDRQLIGEHTRLCDLMVAAHTGDTYLTSGLMADAMAMDGGGIPMLVPHWEFFDEILSDAALYHDNTLESLAQAFRTLTPEKVAAARQKSAQLKPRYAPATLGPVLGQYLREVRLGN
jgi:hypothetical protein